LIGGSGYIPVMIFFLVLVPVVEYVRFNVFYKFILVGTNQTEIRGLVLFNEDGFGIRRSKT
jgi:hypothetical protein